MTTLHSTLLSRAGGKTKTNWLHKLSVSTAQLEAQTRSDRWTAVHTQLYRRHSREIRRVAVTCNNCATSTISHSLNTSGLFGTMGRCASKCLYKSHQAPGTAVPLHPTTPAVPAMYQPLTLHPLRSRGWYDRRSSHKTRVAQDSRHDILSKTLGSSGHEVSPWPKTHL